MADQAAILARVIEIANSTAEIERRLEQILGLLAGELALDGLAVFALDRAKETLTLRHFTGAPPLADPLRLPVAGSAGSPGRPVGLIGLAAARREPIEVPDLGSPPPELPEPMEGLPPGWRRFRAMVAVPIVDDTFSYGVLLALREAPGALSEADLRLLAVVVREIAGALRTAQIHFEAKKMVGELTALYEIGKACSSTLELDELLALIVRTSVRIVRARGAILRLLDESSGELRVKADHGLEDLPGARDPLRVGEGIAGEVASTGLPILVKDTRRDPRVADRSGQILSSLLCVPLIFKGKVIGTLSLYDKEGEAPGSFDEDDRYLLSTVASQIANAIGNAVIFNRVETLARDLELKNRELSILYEVGRAMMTTIQRDRLLHVILTAVTIGDGLGFNRALLFLLNEAERTLDGTLGVGPDSPEEAGAVWHRLAAERRTLGDLVRSEALDLRLDTDLNRTVQEIRIPMSEEGNVLVRTVLDGEGHNVPDARSDPGVPAWLADRLSLSAFATVPLLAKGRALGVILVDNRFNQRPITDEDLRFLLMFANQAGLAVESATLYATLEAAHREQRAMHARLLQSEKLAALGEMAAQVAHEIRNPLVSIGGFARRLHKRMSEDSADRKYTDIIIREVTRLEQILSEILAFSREHRPPTYQAQQLPAIADSALQMMADAFREAGIEVRREYAVGLPSVVCDGTQIRQAFVNLLNNAREAMSGGGTLTVRIARGAEDLEHGHLGPHLVVEVEDTGGGIPEAVMEHIFTPFYTTKDTGTGLGLAIVKRVVQSHAGSIEIDNRPGEGVRFVLRLPLRPDQQAGAAVGEEAAAAVGGTG